MELIYGTRNPAKIISMKKMLVSLDVEVIGLPEVDIVEPKEVGNTPLENAMIKAKSYFRQINKPLFSCDSALVFEEVSPEDQPGVAIRRLGKKKMTDEELIHFYANLAKKYEGKITAQYQNAICLILDKNKIYSYAGTDICSEKFYLIDQPHSLIRDGFPLDTLSVDIESGKYYYDTEQYKVYENLKIEKGFRAFFASNLKNTVK